HPERLRDAIIGSIFEAHDGVRLCVPRSEHHDRGINVRPLGTEGLANADAVDTWQQNVQDDHVESRSPSNCDGLRPVAELGDVKSRDAQMQSHEVTYRGLVVDDQRLPPSRRPSGLLTHAIDVVTVMHRTTLITSVTAQ